jgi:hypothetical protein
MTLLSCEPSPEDASPGAMANYSFRNDCSISQERHVISPSQGRGRIVKNACGRPSRCIIVPSHLEDDDPRGRHIALTCSNDVGPTPNSNIEWASVHPHGRHGQRGTMAFQSFSKGALTDRDRGGRRRSPTQHRRCSQGKIKGRDTVVFRRPVGMWRTDRRQT